MVSDQRVTRSHTADAVNVKPAEWRGETGCKGRQGIEGVLECGEV